MFDLLKYHHIIILTFSVMPLLTAVLLLLRKNRKLALETTTDILTGLHNSRYLNEALEQELSRAWRLKHMMQVLFIDLDNFKAVNDTLGHHVGDQMLMRISVILRNQLRKHDIYGRWYNGDEFLIILPETEKFHAHDVAERLSLEIAEAGKKIAKGKKIKNGNGKNVEIDASIGIFSFDPENSNSETISADDLVKEVDADMYTKKEAKKVMA